MNEVTFKRYLEDNAYLIDLEIRDIFSDWNNESAHISPRLQSLISLLEEGSKGGKRIRGTLVELGYAMTLERKLNLKEEKAILQVAVAYEIFQTSILAHDDIIDKSTVRRGMPTIYEQLGDNHYGISQTISLGDLGFFKTYKMLAENGFSDDAKAKAIAFFSDSITKTVLGQILDVELANKKFEITDNLIEEIVQVYKLKTAYYTFVAPLSLGAILAGADEEVLQNIKVFGEKIGILFQIRDDIIDIFGIPQNSNKDTGADIKEGKITLLYAMAMQKANAEQRHVLSTYYGKALIDKNAVTKIQEVFIQTGTLEYVQSQAEQFEKDARSSIPALSGETTTQKLFEEMVDYISGKEKNE